MILSADFSSTALLFFFFRHRIISAGVPRITPENTPEPHQRPFQGAKALNGRIGIIGTGGIKFAARRRIGGNILLILPNQPEQHTFQCRIPAS